MPVDPNKKLNVGDAVSVEILEDQDGAVPRQVSPTGEIDVFPLGRVKVAGKTTTEAEAEVKRKLEANYYHTASVRISLDRVNPTAALRKVQVTGEVRSPGPIESPISEPLYLTEAIARVGGFTQWSVRDQVRIFRAKGSSSVHNVKDIINEGKVSEDPLLEDGDRVLVKKKWFNVTTN